MSNNIPGGVSTCPASAVIFGYLGVASCSVLSNFGSAWGTWKAGMGLCKMGVDYPKGIMKNLVPIVMAGVLGIYGLIVSVIITQGIKRPIRAEGSPNGYTQYSLYTGYAHLAAGLCCGISCLAAGGTIGYIGDVGIRCFGMKVSGGKRAWVAAEEQASGNHDPGTEQVSQDSSNKLYVGLLIMLIFSEALALYGMIVALLLCQGKDIPCLNR